MSTGKSCGATREALPLSVHREVRRTGPIIPSVGQGEAAAPPQRSHHLLNGGLTMWETVAPTQNTAVQRLNLMISRWYRRFLETVEPCERFEQFFEQAYFATCLYQVVREVLSGKPLPLLPLQHTTGQPHTVLGDAVTPLSSATPRTVLAHVVWKNKLFIPSRFSEISNNCSTSDQVKKKNKNEKAVFKIST